MAIGDEVVLASDPKEVEEEELEDPQGMKKAACSEVSECASVKASLVDCTPMVVVAAQRKNVKRSYLTFYTA